MKAIFTALLLSGCVGSFEPANTPANLASNTTREHCVVLDDEHIWGMSVAAGMASVGASLGTVGALEVGKNDSAARVLVISAGIATAIGVGAGALGLYASNAYHDNNQCLPK
jgi:hypothetical protein